MLRLHSLSKQYQKSWAVRDVHLELAEGEFLTLLGPSGSGKTTTLKMVAGLELPTTGEIWVRGENITFLSPDKRGLGMVFQNYALFPHMTVRENVAFPLKMRRSFPRAEIESKVREILRLVQLEEYIDRYPSLKVCAVVTLVNVAMGYPVAYVLSTVKPRVSRIGSGITWVLHVLENKQGRIKASSEGAC